MAVSVLFPDQDREWTPFTPVWTAVTLGTGTAATWGRYVMLGKTVAWHAGFRLGTGGSVTGVMQMQGPFVLKDPSGGAGTFGQVGTAYASDVNVNLRYGGAFGTGLGNDVWIYRIADAAQNGWTSTVPFTWAVDDTFYATGVYEVV